MKLFYALYDGKDFICRALTKKDFQEKVQKSFWNWRGMQPMGTKANFEEYMKGLKIVQITVTEVKMDIKL